MEIAIIGIGNVGGTLASKWSQKGHHINLGVKNSSNPKVQKLLENANTSAHTVEKAVENSEVIVLATPAMAAIEVAQSLGDTSNKVIIDAMNIVMGKGPKGYDNTSDAVLDNTASKNLAKCFNTTGYNNMADPKYGDFHIDNFVCGDSEKAKSIAVSLSKDMGFSDCYDVGGNDKFHLMEQFAWFWINLAMPQGYGREMGFKLLKR